MDQSNDHLRKNTKTTAAAQVCAMSEEFYFDNMTGKDIYNLIMLRTESGLTLPKIAKYIENSESVD